MAETSNPKVLRIGIIQNNEFIEERLLRKRGPVTVGQAPRNTFAIPSSAMPGQHLLFDLQGSTYRLRLRPGMSGKVAIEDQPLDVEDLKQRGYAKPEGDGLAVTLNERSRGRVVIGDVTFLFQFVAAPPPPSRLQLPAAIRGSMVRSLDWPFVSVLLSSFVIQVFSIAFIVTRDYPEPPRGIKTLPDRFVRILEQTSKPPESKKEERTDDENKEKEKDETKEPEKVADAEKKPERQPLTEEQVRKRAERMRQANVRNKTILKFVGTLGGEGEGTIVDTLKSGAIDVKMAEAFDGATGLEVADSDSALRDRRTAAGVAGGTGREAGLEDGALEARGVGPVASGQKGGEVAVKGSVELKRLSDDDVVGTGVLSSQRIAEIVGRRKATIKGCYEKQLRHNTKLAGKVKIQFTIEESGRVSNARVVEDTLGDPLVGKCIAASIQRFRFDKPDGGSVTVAFPFVFAPTN